jgi:hypothetical protein
MVADEESNREHQKRDTVHEDSLKRRFQSMKSEGFVFNEFDGRSSMLSSVVKHPFFDVGITALVLLNSFIIGAQTHHQAMATTSAGQGDAKTFFGVMEVTFTLIFSLELAARITVHQRNFYLDPNERHWNMIDAFLVTMSLIDLVLNVILTSVLGGDESGAYSSVFLTKLLRMLRVARIMRIARTVRFVSELRVMIQMIVNSLVSLFWILVILLAVMYVFAIIITSGVTEYLKPSGGSWPDGRDAQALHQVFGSLFETMYTLYKTMSGGINWGEVSAMLRDAGWAYEGVFVGYTFFTIFAVVNIVTGVFVDGAIELAKRDRTVLMQKQAKDTQAQESHLLGLLKEIDVDGDEMITADEFKEAMQRQEIREFISAMQVEVHNPERFFDLLDHDNDGEVDLVEFVEGMQRLRGEAKSVDVHMMVNENRKMLQMVTGLMDLLEEQLAEEDEDDEFDGEGDVDLAEASGNNGSDELVIQPAPNRSSIEGS